MFIAYNLKKNPSATLSKNEMVAITKGNSVVKIQDIVIKDGFPQLSLIYIAKDPNATPPHDIVVKHVWLSPFRGYSFQVSMTIDGENDLGSTQVVGLGNVVEAAIALSEHQGDDVSYSSSRYASNFRMQDLPIPIFTSMAKSAILEFLVRADSRLRGISQAGSVPYMQLATKDHSTLDLFVYLCIKYVVDEEVAPLTDDEIDEHFYYYDIAVSSNDMPTVSEYLDAQIATIREQLAE